MSQPVCTIVAGPNGAGKTTFAMRYLTEVSHCRRFINADLIAAGLSPLAPESEQVAAGKLFLAEIQQAMARRESFSFETTLAGRSNLKRVRLLQDTDWRVELIYLYLPSVDLSAARVAERVRHGGHDIPHQSIVRRYPRSLRNLLELYAPLCDSTICLENSRQIPRLIFSETPEGRRILDATAYKELLLGTSI